MATKNEETEIETDDKLADKGSKDEADKGETEEIDVETDEDDAEAAAAKAKAEADKKAKAKKPKIDLEDPAVKKAIEKAAREAEAKGRKAAAAEAQKAVDDAKLSEAERLRKAKEEAETATKAAEKRAADAEAREALRDAMDDLAVKPAGGVARESIVAAFTKAREKDPDADPAVIIAEIQKSDAYLFASTAAAKKTEVEDDGEEKPAKKTSTDTRGGKTASSVKVPEKKDETGVIDIASRDPRKIRDQLAKAGIRSN